MMQNMLTYRQVKEYLTELADLVPAKDVQCEEFTMSYSPEYIRKEKGEASYPETVIIQFKLEDKRVYLKVETDNRKKV